MVIEIGAGEIHHLSSDNGIFNAELFVEDCKNKFQTQSFYSVGSHHQNSLVEWSNQTIMYMAWTFMVHVPLHWNKYGADNLALWGFALKHSVWLHNRIPDCLSGLTSLKLLNKTKANHPDLLCTHVWECPVYILDSKLQDRQKIPKWNSQSCLCQFLGFSDVHFTLVANICHLSTSYMSPQYHLFFDDLSETVFGTGNDALLDYICNQLFDSACDFYFYVQ